MLETILTSLGVSTEEIKLYNILLNTSSLTVGTLSKKSGIPRTTLYGLLRSLERKGFITESEKNNIKTFQLKDPAYIQVLINQKIEALQSTRQQYAELLPQLQKNLISTYQPPKVQLFEGTENLKQVLKDMLLYYDIETYSVWPIKHMLKLLGEDFFIYLNKERIKNRLYTKALWPSNQQVSVKTYPYLGFGKEHYREIKILPKELDFTLGYWIYGNKIAFLSSQEESIGFIIESASLRQTLLAQFEVLWKLSTHLK